MEPEIRKLLYDVQQAGTAIQAFTAGKTYADFLADPILQAAVERKFEVVGEALARLRRRDEEAFERIPDARLVVGFRNVLAHGYDTIDPAIVWDAATNNLPRLLAVVEPMLKR